VNCVLAESRFISVVETRNHVCTVLLTDKHMHRIAIDLRSTQTKTIRLPVSNPCVLATQSSLLHVKKTAKGKVNFEGNPN
jgi:hypothetical protein